MIVTADHVLPVCDPPIPGGAVAVVDGVVADVGTLAEVRSRRPGDTGIVELPGRILAPGLVRRVLSGGAAAAMTTTTGPDMAERRNGTGTSHA